MLYCMAGRTSQRSGSRAPETEIEIEIEMEIDIEVEMGMGMEMGRRRPRPRMHAAVQVRRVARTHALEHALASSRCGQHPDPPSASRLSQRSTELTRDHACDSSLQIADSSGLFPSSLECWCRIWIRVDAQIKTSL